MNATWDQLWSLITRFPLVAVPSLLIGFGIAWWFKAKLVERTISELREQNNVLVAHRQFTEARNKDLIEKIETTQTDGEKAQSLAVTLQKLIDRMAPQLSPNAQSTVDAIKDTVAANSQAAEAATKVLQFDPATYAYYGAPVEFQTKRAAIENIPQRN